MTETVLMTITDAAKIMSVSRATLYRLVQAGEYDLKIARGIKCQEDVPITIRGYLGCKFPRMIRLGPRCLRLNRVEVETWVASRSAEGV